MRLMISATAICFPLLCLAPFAFATSTIVPDDFPTIQAALVSGADSVLVRPGSYPEDVVVNRRVLLLALATGYSAADPPVDIESLTFATPLLALGGIALARGLDVAEPVVLAYGLSPALHVVIEVCRCRQGIGQSSDVPLVGTLEVRTSVIVLGVAARLDAIDLDANVLSQGGINVRCQSSATIHGNTISGPATLPVASGIEINGDFGGEIDGNQIRQMSTGILVHDPLGTRAVGNQVTDCAAAAIQMQATPSAPPRALGTSVVTIAYNTIGDCGGHGIDVASPGGVFDVRGNLVQRVGAAGIHADGWAYMHVDSNRVEHSRGPGIWLDEDAYGEGVSDNRVLYAGGDGLLLVAGTASWRNIAGHCGGSGIAISSGTVSNSTVYFNRASGIAVRGPASVSHTIGYGNQRFGLEAGAHTPSLDCNDWKANVEGATQGVPPGATDLFLEPLFCDLAGDDPSLSAGSPLLAAPGCGLIGALGLGCSTPTSVPNAGRAGLVLSAAPRPARGFVQLSWRGADGAARVEVYDVAGALRWGRTVEGPSGAVAWSLRDLGGRALPAGIYLARLVSARAVVVERIVVVP